MDIYFNELYGKLGEFIEEGECISFHIKTKNGTASNMFILRKAPYLVDGIQYYDIVTPYGYGGPIVTEASNSTELVKDYNKEFSVFCKDRKIVSEFIRYHPIYRNWEPFSDVYENCYSRHTIGTNLRDYDDPIQSEFSKSARKELRRAESNDVTCTIHESPSSLMVFRKLYEKTMDRNGAPSVYYFPTDYYRILETKLSPYVLEIQAHYHNEVIASEIYLIQGEFMHAHLLGSDERLLQTDGGIMLEATAARWGKAHGYSFIHHGGGRTSSDNDSLYQYKKKFGRHTQFDFYVGKKVWDSNIYKRLLDIRLESGPIKDDDFFPLYRAQ